MIIIVVLSEGPSDGPKSKDPYKGPSLRSRTTFFIYVLVHAGITQNVILNEVKNIQIEGPSPRCSSGLEDDIIHIFP
jgi:hypothetical protein